MLLAMYLVYALVLSIALRAKGLATPIAEAEASPPSAERRVTRVLVVGATGGSGRQLVAQALERGYDVTAPARNPAALDLTHPRLRVVGGNVLDPASLDEAARGQDAVLCALGHKKFFLPNQILSEGTRNPVRAMETQHVDRLVCETALGLGDSAGCMGVYYTLFLVPVRSEERRVG